MIALKLILAASLLSGAFATGSALVQCLQGE